jgi:drug/metabolite transporter (DMT)-like permease
MNLKSLIYLFSLAAIWGASFIFMRVAVSSLGPVLLSEFRVLLAAIFLFMVSLHLKKGLQLKEDWKHFFILGFFNSTLPFLLFTYAALNLTASLLSIINSTAPIWGVIILSVWTRKTLSKKTLLGLVLGITGVYLLVGFDHVALQPEALPAIIATLLAAFSYGVASTYAQFSKQIEPFSNAHGSMWAASIMLLPFLPFFPANATPAPDVIYMVIVLGVLCTGIAYIIYFNLIADIGAPSALTVTYLVPVFGILWGVIFLDETVGWHTLFGTITILMGTALVTNFKLNSLFKKQKK